MPIWLYLAVENSDSNAMGSSVNLSKNNTTTREIKCKATKKKKTPKKSPTTITAAAGAGAAHQPNCFIRWYHDIVRTVTCFFRSFFYFRQTGFNDENCLPRFTILNFQSMAHFWLIHHKIENPMRNNNGIFIRARCAMTWDAPFLYMYVAMWCAQLSIPSSRYLLRIFQSKTKHIRIACVHYFFFFFFSLLLSLIHCYCYFSSWIFFFSVVVAIFSLSVCVRARLLFTLDPESYLFWTPNLVNIHCLFIITWCLNVGMYFYSFVWSALITLHVRVRFKWNGYAYRFVCTYFILFGT